ncbi:MAG: hypothetical protein ABJF11_01125 [Reichenbachiella sp.]|uniref:hypothetical protein n=1 Tax=Reichenbachiella sp. TaxID=2184521 RepID=UPI003263CAD2
MERIGIFLFIVFVNVFSLKCQNSSEPHFTQAELEEFELLNLCHCHEYLTLRNYDYIKWISEEWKEKRLEEIENTVFGQYQTRRRINPYFQTKYDSSLFLKNGFSVYLGAEMNFRRLDSLYYEPIVQHYVRKISKTENLPYLGLGDNNFFMDCFYKVKEIPLEQELEYFLRANKRK